MDQIPLFPNTPEQPKEVEKIDPLTNPEAEPNFSLFPDSDEILYVAWNDMIGKWVAIYKSDNNRR